MMIKNILPQPILKGDEMISSCEEKAFVEVYKKDLQTVNIK